MAQITINAVPDRDIVVPQSFITEHMLSASGDHIKVYLLLLDAVQNNHVFDTSNIADLLDTTEKDVGRSLSYWEKQGLIKLQMTGKAITGLSFITSDSAPIRALPAEEPAPEKHTKQTAESSSVASQPPLTDPNMLIVTKEIIAEAEANPDFVTLSHLTQTYAKRILNTDDYELLIRFFYRMNKDLDICETIVAYCADKGKLTMKNVDKLSIECLTKGFVTLESVKYHLNRTNLEKSIIDILGLSCTRLSQAQSAMLQKWSIEYHFGLNVIKEACNRGSMATNGKNVFQYVDSILSKWYGDGVTSLDDIAKKDAEFKAAQEKKYGKTKSSKQSAGPEAANPSLRFEQRDIDFDADEALFMTSHLSGGQNGN